MDIDASRNNNSRKTVIITGAGGGLGRAITHRLLKDGFHCVLAGRTTKSLERTIALAGTDGKAAAAVACDIRKPYDRQRLIDRALAQSGRLYGLVNNAGLAKADPLLDENLADWREIIETNLEAAYFLSQQSIEHMRSAREGRIVNISSVYGLIGFDNRGYGARAPEISDGDRGPFRQSAYAASKGGLIQLTRDLAAGVGRWGITVNAISPGSIPHPDDDTDPPKQTPTVDDASASSEKPGLGDKVDPEILRALAAQVPLQRLGTVEEIAGPVRFLLSEDAGYITGANLVVDGGWTIW